MQTMDRPPDSVSSHPGSTPPKDSQRKDSADGEGNHPETSSTHSSAPQPAIESPKNGADSCASYALELGRCVGDFACSLATMRDEMLHDIYGKELERLMAENAELKSSLASAAENGNGHSDGDTTNGPKPTAAATVKFRPFIPSTISSQQRLQAALGQGLLENGHADTFNGNGTMQPSSILTDSRLFGSAHNMESTAVQQMRSTSSEMMLRRGLSSPEPTASIKHHESRIMTYGRRTTPMGASEVTVQTPTGAFASTLTQGTTSTHGDSHLSLRTALTRALESNMQLANQAANVAPQARGQSRMLHKERQDALAQTLNHDHHHAKRGRGRWALEPDGVTRAFWETIALVALIYDSVLFPYVLAWNPEQTEALRIGTWTTLVIWTVDLFLNFFTGYIKGDGSAEMNHFMIVKSYMQTWFVCDFLTVVGDWLSTGLELAKSTGDNYADIVRLLRIFKVNRLMRTAAIGLRLFRFSKRFFLQWRLSMVASPAVTFGLQALKILGVILWINHVFTCIWFGIGSSSLTDTGFSWLDMADTLGGEGSLENPTEATPYRDATPLYQYTTAMHWSMTQMTPGSMQVFPQNSSERICNIFCLVFGLLFGTTLVGQLSSKLVQYNMNRQEELRRTGLLRQFLKEHQIQAPLAARVYKQITDRMSQRKKLTEDKVPGLTQLTVNLRMEVRVRMYLGGLNNHPLFSAWSQNDVSMLKDLCCFGSVSWTFLSPGEELFTPSSEATSAFLFSKGSLKYIASGGAANMKSEQSLASPGKALAMKAEKKSSQTEAQEAQGEALKRVYSSVAAHTDDIHVEEGAWLSEICLYMNWQHLGTAESVKECELLNIPYEGFLQVIRNHHHCKVSEMTFDWAMAFQEQTQADHDLDYTMFDIGVQHASIVMCMHERSRSILHSGCLEALEMSMAGNWLKGKGLSDLEEELKKGACVLTVDGKGEFVRTVTVVVARLSFQGKYMVQMAKKDEHGSWTNSVMLPGTKLKQGEDAGKVVEGVLAEDLKKFAELAKFESCTQEAEKKESGSYGVKSQYLKLIFTATLDCLPDDLQHEDSDTTMAQFQMHVMQDKRGRSLLYGWVTADELAQLQAGAFAEEIKLLGKDQRDSMSSGDKKVRPSLQQRFLGPHSSQGVGPEGASHTAGQRFRSLFVPRTTTSSGTPTDAYDEPDSPDKVESRPRGRSSENQHMLRVSSLLNGSTDVQDYGRAMSLPARGKPRLTALTRSLEAEPPAAEAKPDFHWEVNL